MNRSIRFLRISYLITGATVCMGTSAMAVNRYVDPATSASTPNHYQTIASAMAALQPGDTLTIASGIYRETMQFPSRNWSAGMPTVIRGSGQVVIVGADIVTGWTKGENGVFYRTWPSESEQVIVNGTALQQIGGTVFDGYPVSKVAGLTGILPGSGGIWPGRIDGDASSMPNNSFYYDSTTNRLYVRASANLNSQRVEVSTRAYGLLGMNVAGVKITNVQFRYGNTSVKGRNGFVTLSGQNIVVDHVMVSDTDSVGMEVDGDNNQVTYSTANSCGQVGMKARGNNVLLAYNVTNYNNTRNFNKWWEAGGIKIVGNNGLINSVVNGHTSIGNIGDGIWFDWGNQNDLIENSISEYNAGFGIQYEASSGAKIVGNRVIANGQRGIYLPSSSYSTVQNNLVAGNGLEGIAIIDEGRTDPNGVLNLHPIGNAVTNNVLAWNGYALTIPGTTSSTVVDRNIYVGQGVQVHFFNSWSDAIASLVKWQQITNLDLHSIIVDLPIDAAFASSIQAKQKSPNLIWVQRLPPVTGTPTSAPTPPGAVLFQAPTNFGKGSTQALSALSRARVSGLTVQ
jgi:parallel beta-helix repeat protein